MLEAKQYFTEALQVFTTIDALHQAARIHTLLAPLAHAQGQLEATATHLKEAHALFIRLRLSRDVEDTEQLAHASGLTFIVRQPGRLRRGRARSMDHDLDAVLGWNVTAAQRITGMRYGFANCELDTERALLYRADQLITLPRQVYKVLTYLLEHRGRLVSKDRIKRECLAAGHCGRHYRRLHQESGRAVGDTGRTQRIIAMRFGYGYTSSLPWWNSPWSRLQLAR